MIKKIILKNWKIILSLFLLTLAVYANSFVNDFVSDDIQGIKENPYINSFKYIFLPPHNYLRQFFVLIIHKIFGLRPFFYRFPTIISHFFLSFVIFLILKKFFRKPIPLFTALIFVVHPMLVESVIWIAAAQYVYGAVFLMLSFLSYLVHKQNLKYFYLVLANVFFVLGFLTWEKAIFFPLVLVLYELCFDNLRENWKKVIPFFLTNTLWILWLFHLLSQKVVDLQTKYYQTPQITNPFIQTPVAVAYYLKMIFWPLDLTLYHSELTFTQSQFILRFLILLGFFGLLAFLFKKSRKLFFWLTFFLLALSPTLIPLGVGWVVAERYAYLASLGVFVGIAFLIAKIGVWVKNKKVSYIILVILLLAFATRTVIRNRDWRNQDTLWLAAARTSPSSHQNHNNLGDLYARRGDLPKAIEEFKKAIELKPNYGDAYHNLANVYFRNGQKDLAVENYQKALSLNPLLWQSHQNLAYIAFEEGDFNGALGHLQKAVEINSQRPELFSNLGLVYIKLGDKQKAKESFQESLKLDPTNQKVQSWLLELSQ